MSGELSLGERIAWYRRRRGLSQEVVAGLVDRTVDWLSKVENNRITIDRLSVIRTLSQALDVSLADLLNEPSLHERSAGGPHAVPAVRAALMDYRQLMQLAAISSTRAEPVSLPHLQRDLHDVWRAYQDSRFGYVTHRVPGLLAQAQEAVAAYDGDFALRANAILALTYQATAGTLAKVGEADLAWIASDRGLAAAQQSGEPAVLGSLLRSVTHSLLSTGRNSEAVKMTEQAISALTAHLGKADETTLSVHGALLLGGAMAASRANERGVATDLLEEAEQLARRLGRDGNLLWTAFGPTNVAVHRVSTAMELGDVQVAVDLAPRIDTSALPVERQVRHTLETARALSMRNRRDDALEAVLDAEQLAPEQVRYHFISRNLVQGWMRQQRGKPSFRLVGLAERLRVV